MFLFQKNVVQYVRWMTKQMQFNSPEEWKNIPGNLRQFPEFLQFKRWGRCKSYCISMAAYLHCLQWHFQVFAAINNEIRPLHLDVVTREDTKTTELSGNSFETNFCG